MSPSPDQLNTTPSGVTTGGETALRDSRSELVTLASGIDHPECVSWYEGTLYFGTESGHLFRISPGSNIPELVASTGGFLLGLAFDETGACIACDVGRGEVLRIQLTGDIEVIADSVQGRRLVSPNYPVVASDGRIWVSESGSSWDADDGYLFCLKRGSAPQIADEECHLYPNGLALDERGGAFYVVEGRLPGVSRYSFDNGKLGSRTEYVRLPGTVPDGLALDREGRLYIGCCRPDRIYVIEPDGALQVFLDDYTGEYLCTPTNLSFGGPQGRTLFIASLGGWSIKSIDVAIPGLAWG